MRVDTVRQVLQYLALKAINESCMTLVTYVRFTIYKRIQHSASLKWTISGSIVELP